MNNQGLISVVDVDAARRVDVAASVRAIRRVLRPVAAKARRTRRALKAQVALFRALRRENRLTSTAAFLALSIVGLRRERRMRIAGADLTLRTAAPDALVALTTLTREFEALTPLVDRAETGLIVDAGGYIGTAAIRLARLFPDARIVTLEPCRENFAVLARNVRAFPNIVAFNCAMGASDGRLTLSDRGTGDVGFTIVPAPDDAASRGMYDVEVVSVPTLLKRLRAEEVAFMKMDIEGAETEMLEQPATWLDRVGVLMIELHERITAGCESAFRSATADRINRGFGGEKHVSFRTASATFALAAE
jgi:FkbM family methyltransferase